MSDLLVLNRTNSYDTRKKRPLDGNRVETEKVTRHKRRRKTRNKTTKVNVCAERRLHFAPSSAAVSLAFNNFVKWLCQISHLRFYLANVDVGVQAESMAVQEHTSYLFIRLRVAGHDTAVNFITANWIIIIFGGTFALAAVAVSSFQFFFKR